MSIIKRARPAIMEMKAYSSARSLANMDGSTVFLDANEMPCEPLIGVKNYARYAPQQPPELMAALAGLYGVEEKYLLVSRGADEAIDLLIRAFCEPGHDNIIICPPAFPMYAQSARLQDAGVKTVPLDEGFKVDADAIIKAVDAGTKIVFLCSPNNPTANLLDRDAIEDICKALADKALVVVDEAYIEFSGAKTCAAMLGCYGNLAVLRTLSKAYALAGVRCGVLIAHPEVIAVCGKILAPYPLPVPVVETVLKTLEAANRERLALKRKEVMATRDWFMQKLKDLPAVQTVFPSDANFVLARFQDAKDVMALCRANGFILRDQSHQPGLDHCIRISMGTQEQIEALLHLLKTGTMIERPKGRTVSVTRRTKETAIHVSVDLDHTDPVHIHTGVGFYDHMLEQIARHGGFSMTMECVGDLHIDAHHTIEDCAIALGQALKAALGDKVGIGRYGFTLPMDESLGQAVIDLSGRAFFKFDGVFPESKVGDMPTDMVAHVFRSLAENMQATIHLSVTGENAHHMVEACFKAFGRALRQAIKVEGNTLPSTKGVL